MSPWWQHYVIQNDSTLLHSEIESIPIDKHVWQRVEFRNQLLDIGHVVLAC